MATLEYAALAVLVSAVLLVAGAAADARAIGGAVGAQLRRAYCVVAGGDCFARGGPRPCVVRSGSSLAEHRIALGLVRLRDGRTVLVEELSDGTFRVSLTQSTGGGAGVQLGGRLRLLGRALGTGAEAEAALSLGYGRAFVAGDADAARRLVRRLEDEGPEVGGALPGIVRFLRGRDRGEERERTVSVSSHAEAQAALEALELGPRAAALRGIAGSIRLDRHTGDRAIGLRLGGETTAALGGALAQAAGGMVASTRVELVLDRDRRPRELVVSGVGAVHGSARLASGGEAAGDLREVSARLDVTASPPAARLAGGDVGAVRALAAQLARDARIDVRHYAFTREEDTFGGRMAGIGVSRTTLDETARLVAAEGREPGLGWSRRLDCLAV